ncbi:MAG TPA: VWA domain-containing protein [Nitrososphaeraceae archaeon]|jgi:uncharacterized protein with von Willebrand factor type A (vWA) domain
MSVAKSDKLKGIKKFTYTGVNRSSKELASSNRMGITQTQSTVNSNLVNRYLEVIGRELLREEIPSLDEIEKKLQDTKSTSNYPRIDEQKYPQPDESSTNTDARTLTIIAELKRKGYLKDSSNWLSKKGFLAVGERLLYSVMKALKSGDIGMHETTQIGSGSLVLDSTRRYELGDDIRLLNVPRSILNAVERMSKAKKKVILPIEVLVNDLEEYETKQDVRMSVAYCIDLSSTMRYSTMYAGMSRIEAAKRALWSLYLLNQKYFSSDSIYIIGFGALASKVSPFDIPYLKTFEPGTDFLHYTNYQAAFRLAGRIFQNDNSMNRRIVLITDGHPSACFIDSNDEREKILSQRPYSEFYYPEKQTLEKLKKSSNLELDTSSGSTVYLCYRYRQVDQYIGEKTILEAKKCRNMGIEIDTIMISEEDSLLAYVNEMEKFVKGRSYYINPSEIDKILLTDYLNNKKIILSSNS